MGDSDSSGQPLVRRSRRFSASEVNLESGQEFKCKMWLKTSYVYRQRRIHRLGVISKRVHWKDQVTLAGNPSSSSNEVIRDSRENKKRWSRLTGLVRSGRRFLLTKDTRALLLESFEAFKGEGLDCSFHSLKDRAICKTSGLCTHTLAEIFKYMGDTIDDSFFCLEATLGLSKPFSGTVAPKILRESRYSKQRRSKRRGKRTRTN